MLESRLCPAWGGLLLRPRSAPVYAAPPLTRGREVQRTGCTESCQLVQNVLCSNVPQESAFARRGDVLAARASLTTSSTTETQGWWKQQSNLWVDVHTEEEFYAAVNSGDKMVFVDFYATWCNGCQRSYPELCKLAADRDITKHFKFVKVCIEELKRLSKDLGVKALPHAQVHAPGRGLLVGLDIPPSKVKHLRHNLQVMTHNPGMWFRTDPNGFVMPYKPSAEEEAAAAAALAAAAAAAAGSGPAQVNVVATPADAARAAEVAALEGTSSGLFGHLLSSVLGMQGNSAGQQLQQQPPSTTTDSNRSGSNGDAAHAAHGSNGEGAAAVAAAAAATSPVSASDAAAKAAFLARHGHEYGYGGLLDSLYPSEVGCRMAPNEHYMDYTGSSVYCQSQLDAVFQELRSNMFGNPHSANPSSSRTSDRVEEVRDLVLSYFNADPAEYQVVFTRSATGALQLVGETFPWSSSSTFAYLRENHASVLGMREYALEAGGTFRAVNETFVEAWTADESSSGGLLPLEAAGAVRDAAAATHVGGTNEDSTAVGSSSAARSSNNNNAEVGSAGLQPLPVVNNLFAFPAEDNFAGVKYPLRWIAAVKAKSTAAVQWRVLLDAAAFVPTQRLDLRQVSPDFVSLSFYKMFGVPTGLGALLVRVDAAEVLRKKFWGGGAVSLATSGADFHVLKCRPADKLEDGTVNFLDIIALKHGFAMLDRLGGIAAVQRHVASLTEWLYAQLSGLRHSNGRRMVQIFGKHNSSNSREVQGGIINFEVLKPDGHVFSYKQFEREAAAAGFHVRTGAECNPGACYSYLGVQESEIESLAGKKEGCHDDVEFITVERTRALPRGQPGALSSVDLLAGLASSSVDLGHPGEVASQWVEVPLGSVRVSLGYMSTWEDCHALVQFIAAKYSDRNE